MSSGATDAVKSTASAAATAESRSSRFGALRSPLAFALPALLYLAGFYLWPIAQTALISLGDGSLVALREVATDPTTWIVFWQTFEMALWTTAAGLLLGYPIAYLLVRLPPSAQRMLLLLVLLPFWISTLVRSYAWIAVLGRNGVVNWAVLTLGLADAPLALMYNRLGAMIGMVNVVAPVMILVLYAAFARIDPIMMRVGSVLGGSALYVFCRVWLPLSLPGVCSGCILVFLISLGVFTTPAILGGPGEMSIAMAIELKVSKLLDLPAAAAMSLLLLAVTTALLAVSYRFWVPALFGATQLETAAAMRVPLLDRLADLAARLKLPHSQSKSYWTEERSVGRTALWAAAGLGFAYLLVPVVVVIGLSVSSASFLQFPPRGLSLRWFATFFGSWEWVGSAWRSFLVALMTTALATLLGTATALGLERGGHRRGALTMLFLSPIVVPPTILAFGLYVLFARAGWIGSLPALAAAHVVLALPLVLVTVGQGARALDRSFEFAAAGLGGSPFYVFRRITLPLLRPALVSGAVLAFLTSFDELIIALFLTTARTATLPKRMWDSVRFEVDPTNAAAATLLILISLAMVLITTLPWKSNSRQASRD